MRVCDEQCVINALQTLDVVSVSDPGTLARQSAPGSLEAALVPPRRRSLTGLMGLKRLAVPAAETGGSR